jgi:hypothetical protein
MASEKQLRANRANAKRSTGPKSAVGKTRSRMNSRKHGLTATTLVIGDEDPAHFERLRAELIAQYQPQSALECELVERLSSLLWRLRRVPAFEAAIIEARRAEVEGDTVLDLLEHNEEQSDETTLARSIGLALISDGASDILGKLARHEATLMNAFMKTLQMLLLLQRERASETDARLIEAVALPPKSAD